MSSSKDKAIELLIAWKTAGQTVAVYATSGRRLSGNGLIAEVSADGVRVGTAGLAIEISFSSVVGFDVQPRNGWSMVRVRAEEFECVLFPLAPKPFID